MENMPKLLKAMCIGICPVFQDKQGWHPNGLSKQQLYQGVAELFEYFKPYDEDDGHE